VHGHVTTVNKEICYHIFALVNFYTHTWDRFNKTEVLIKLNFFSVRKIAKRCALGQRKRKKNWVGFTLKGSISNDQSLIHSVPMSMALKRAWACAKHKPNQFF